MRLYRLCRTLLKRGISSAKSLASSIWRIRFTRVIASSHLLVSAYYLLKGDYFHEQKAILFGKSKYWLDSDGADGFPIYKLVRNTHRLEKGLSTAQDARRSVFGEGYIHETVAALEKILANTCYSTRWADTIAWSVDVLDEYFQIVRHTQEIDAACQLFARLKDNDGFGCGRRIPRSYRDLVGTRITYDDLAHLVDRRSSVRSYQQRGIDRALLDEAVRIARLAPSACNRQAFEYRIYDDPESVQRICALLPGLAKSDRFPPVLVCIVGKQGAYFDERDRHVTLIDASLSAMLFQLALVTLDLGACCINWPLIPEMERRMRRLLGIEEHETPILFLTVGHPDPDGMIPYSQKQSVESLRSYVRSGGASDS